jgi:hypothetical protein
MSFLRKVFSTSCLIVSLALLFYVFYKSEIHWGGTKDKFYNIYYIFSGILLFISILTYYLNEKILNYLIISVISTVASLYLFECYLILEKKLVFQTHLNSKKQQYEKKTDKKYDTRTEFEVYNNVKKTVKDVTVAIPISSYLIKNAKIFPLSGKSNSKVVYCNENGYWSFYDSDRFGFRNPDKEWDQQETEYLLVGDSFTNGACVNSPDDIASVLRNLSNKSILNISGDGKGPLTEYASLREYLNSNVKKVLWFYFESNDLKNLNNELSNKILVNYLSDLTFTQQLNKNQNKIDELVDQLVREAEIRETKKIIKFLKMEGIRSIFNNIMPKQYHPNYFQQQTNIKSKFKEILEHTKKLVSKNNSKFYFVYLPDFSRYNTNFDNSDYLEVKKIVNELNIPFIDIYMEVFKRELNPKKLFPFGDVNHHYNEIGYKKVADTIFKLTNN